MSVRTKRSPWTPEEIEGFRAWHMDLLKRLGYPQEIVRELSRARERWLMKIPIQRGA